MYTVSADSLILRNTNTFLVKLKYKYVGKNNVIICRMASIILGILDSPNCKNSLPAVTHFLPFSPSPPLPMSFLSLLLFWGGKSLVFHNYVLQIVLAVGTKLQAVLTKMALQITERHAVVQGIPLVQGSDKYFWFGRPQLLLHLIHFCLFQVSNISPLYFQIIIK